MNLSINLNKIALLRNARGENVPCLEEYAYKAIKLGVDGLTLHPRPDHRHATCNDVISLSKICKEKKVEFNLEGNPFSNKKNDFIGFIDLVEIVLPDQITLVPDEPNQVTSDHGWIKGEHDIELKKIIKIIKKVSPKSRISLFIDLLNKDEPNYQSIDYAIEVGADTIEIHTGQFAISIKNKDHSILKHLKDFINYASRKNLNINAGHDLNLFNLSELIRIGNVGEVSIGHAIITDSLKYGFEDTINRYINLIKNK